jgi:hypothetical protein
MATSRKISMNVFGSRLAIMASKTATRASMNVRKLITQLFKVQHLSSQKKWRMLESENLSKVKIEWNILGWLKTNKATIENIYICIVWVWTCARKLSSTWISTRYMFGARHRYCLCTCETSQDIYRDYILFQIEQL